MVMVLVIGLLRWWYTDGWRQRVKLVSNRLDGTIDYFSIDLLLKTLLAPYRQISAGKVDGSLEVQMRALIDKLFSRIIGMFIRLIILIIGGVMITIHVLIGLIILIGWGLVPLLPIAGIVLTAIGRTP
jgi:hypothetical protein